MLVPQNKMRLLTTFQPFRGGSKISGKGVHIYMYKGVGVPFADFISLFLNFIGNIKMGGGDGGGGGGGGGGTSMMKSHLKCFGICAADVIRWWHCQDKS